LSNIRFAWQQEEKNNKESKDEVAKIRKNASSLGENSLTINGRK